MDFGLGLVLSFTDNASSGMMGAINTLNLLANTASNTGSSIAAQLGTFSILADTMGTSFLKAGTGIMGMFTNLLGKVQNVGSDFENFRITLTALYRDSGNAAAEAEKQIKKLLDFSIDSPFEVNDVKDMLVVLKSQGIEAFEQVKGSISGTRQEQLAWIADLMAFKPDIPAERWKLAFTNFLGSAETKVLRNALDMGEIEEILGHSIGSTVSERMNDLIEIVDKTGITGLAKDLSGTWQGVASNIDDAWTRLYKSIADNGVFKNLKASFMSLSAAILSLGGDEIEALGKTIADGLNIIVAPVAAVTEKINGLIESFVRLCQNNPELVKTVMVVSAIVGGLLVLSGVALKVASSVGYLVMGLKMFGAVFSTVSTAMKAGALKMLATLLPLTAAIGLIHIAWRNDFGGIRTLLTDFMANIRSSFSQARNAMSMNVSGMVGYINDLENKGDFWSNITAGMAKIGLTAKALADAWSDYTLSEDLYLKCKELGILPLIEAVLDLKWRLEHFWKGFKSGFDKGLSTVVGFAKGFTKNFNGTIFQDLIDGATKFFKALTNNDPAAWEKLGEVIGGLTFKFLLLAGVAKIFGKFAPLITPLIMVFSLLGKVLIPIGTLLRGISVILGPIFSLISSLGSAIFGVFSPLLHLLVSGIGTLISAAGSLMGVGTSLATLFSNTIGIALKFCMGLIQGVAGVIQIFLIPIIVFAMTRWDEFKEKILGVWTTLKEEAGAIWGAIRDGLISIWNNLSKAVGSVATKFNELKDRFVSFGNSVKDTPVVQFLAEIGKICVDTVIPAVQGILHIFSTVFQSVWNVVVTVFNAIVSTISSALNSIMGIIGGVLDIIQGIFTGDLDMIWNGVKSVFGNIFSFIGSILGNIASIIGSVLEGILNIWTSIWETIWNIVKGFFSSIAETIGNLLSGVSDTAASIWDTICDVFNTVIDFITGLPSKAIEWGKDFIQGIVDGIMAGIEWIADAAKGVADTITSFLHFSVPDEGPLTEYESWMPDFMQGLADSMTNSQDVVISAIQNFTTHIKTVLNQEVMQAFKMFSEQWVSGMQALSQSTKSMIEMFQSGFNNMKSGLQLVSQSFQQLSVSSKKAFSGMSSGFSQISSASGKLGTEYSSMFSKMLSVTKSSVNNMTSLFKNMLKVYTSSITSMKNTQTSVFNSMASAVSSSFGNMSSSIQSAMSAAVSTVSSAIISMRNAVANINWQLPRLKLPHFRVAGSFDLQTKPPTVPRIDTDWYAKGGVFSSPTIIGVGEQGKEAVVPLENNLGWISELSRMITDTMSSQNTFTPVNSSYHAPVSNTTANKYLTSNVTNNNRSDNIQNDNSVTFGPGSIQITVKDASEESAIKMAKYVMSYIKRQTELDRMASYN